MEEAIRTFAEQFSFQPSIENGPVRGSGKWVVLGMGGSQLAPGLLKMARPSLDLSIHRGYGLPDLPDLEERAIIASSYSGNTEEVLDGFQEARKRGLQVAALSTGGKLAELAHDLPFVRIPETGIQPRAALGYSLRGLMAILGLEQELKETARLAEKLRPEQLAEEGATLAESLSGKIPVVYASDRNAQIAYNWKIKFNETGKIPAFCNEFPELNHNEMTGFDGKELNGNFAFVFLTDKEDHPRVQKRMEVTAKLFRDRDLPVIEKPLQGSTVWEKIFSSLLLADWASYVLAQQYGNEPEQVPMVEELKCII